MNATKTSLDHGKPYTALPSGGTNNWWYVADSVGFNVLQIEGCRGAKFTTQENAEAAATRWNAL